MRRILLIALPSFAVVTMVLALSACGFERSAFDWFDVQPAEDAQSQHASSGPSASSENSAQEKREIEASGEWARGIVADSLQKLADEHAIDPVPDAKEGKAPFEGVFRFEMDKNTLLRRGYLVTFKTDEANKRLTRVFKIKDSKVILAAGTEVLHCRQGKLRHLGAVLSDDVAAEELPTFCPDTELGAALVEDGVPPSAFAGSFEECDYLICYADDISNVVKGYYEGGVDRYDRTTFAVVIDPKQREVVHVESVGSDIPGPSGEVELPGGNLGKFLEEDLEEYLVWLLAN